jgi:hypothetical protein
MGVGFAVTVKGEWMGDTSYDFPPDPLQNALLPYFTVDSKQVDPFDGAIFEGDELDRLIAKLNDAILEFTNKELKWPLDDKEAQKYSQIMKISKVSLVLPRDESIATFTHAIELAKQARSMDEKLHFQGD